MVLETAGFFSGQAESIPFLMTVLVPERPAVAQAIALLGRDSQLTPGQPGFESIRKLFARAVAQQANLGAAAVTAVTAIRVLASTTSSFSGNVFKNMTLRFEFIDQSGVEWDTNGLSTELDSVQASRLFWFGATIFAAGIALQCVGFYFDSHDESVAV